MTSKLSEAKDQGLIMQVVQKFDMHMKNFDSDKNTQLRWVWQLIQNAKDAPNDFGRSKIKQELNDTQFISKHNGNAFTIRQIHSVVAQYSTKQQNNDQERKTTGKYGTGFITTFLIGKVVSIDGFIRIEVDDEEGEEIKRQLKISQEKAQNKKPDSMVVEQSKNKNKKNQKAEDKLKQDKKKSFYYTKFQFQLDRHYEQRDKQLKKKVQRGDQLLTKAVFQGQLARESLMSIPPNQISKNKHKFQHHFNYVDKRTVDSYNTSFAYTIQDDKKIPIIETAMLNVQRLMPYAMLFNEKLQFYEFLDIRTNIKRNLSFAIEKVSLKELKNTKKSNNIHLFTYLFKSQYDQKLKKFKNQEKRYIVAFLGDSKRVYAAIPVSNCGNKWMVQNIGPDHCQLFKDFPLIGSASIQWNAVINSDNFYPNEKRSELMLSHFDKLSENKVIENRKELENCFEGIKELYLFLALEYCVGGFRNLLNFNEQNVFTKQFPLFSKVLKSNINTFCTTKFIPTGQKGNTKCSLKQLQFIELSQTDKEIFKQTQNQMSLSMKINKTFRFLFEDQFVLSEQYYEDFYAKLHKGTDNSESYLHKQKIITINTIKQCLKEIETKGNLWLKRKFMGNLFSKLEEIYSLLIENNIQFGQYIIVLNENNEFKSIIKAQLKVKKIDPVVEQIFLFLDIDIKKFLIKQQLSKVFISDKRQPYFDDKVAAQFILDKFSKLLNLEGEINQLQILDHENALCLLFSLLLTLKEVPQKPKHSGSSVQKKTILPSKESNSNKKQDKIKVVPNLDVGKIKKFKLFSKVESFKVFGEIKNLAELKYHFGSKLLEIFVQEFTKYFVRLQNQYKTSFTELCKHQLNMANEDEGSAFFFQLFSDSLLGEKLSSLNLKLTLDNTFSQSYTVNKLAENIAYPNKDDVQIYEILRQQSNNIFIQPIKQRLLMPVYPKTDQIHITTYSHLFNDVKYYYDSLNEIKKSKVLSYAKSLNDQFTKSTSVNPTVAQKHNAWKDIIDSRVVKMFNLKNSLKTFEEEPIKEFLYDLFDNEHELKKVAEVYGKRNRSKDSISEVVFENTNMPNKKIKKQ